MKWMELNKNDSNALFNLWAEEPEANYDPSYEKIRMDILNIFNASKTELDIKETDVSKKGYSFDLLFGLRLYELLSNQNFTMRDATNDGLWRYLSMRVVPDIVFHRWGLRPERFWSRGRRIWLKTLWWYIHLSYQGTLSKTHKVLKNNTSDEIVQLVERAGNNGYRVLLYREIMKEYATISKESKDSSSIFRKVMKLNTARCKMIEPELVVGGVESYVKELFKYFETNK